MFYDIFKMFILYKWNGSWLSLRFIYYSWNILWYILGHLSSINVIFFYSFILLTIYRFRWSQQWAVRLAGQWVCSPLLEQDESVTQYQSYVAMCHFLIGLCWFNRLKFIFFKTIKLVINRGLFEFIHTPDTLIHLCFFIL
jgi:hypothetical protein